MASQRALFSTAFYSRIQAELKIAQANEKVNDYAQALHCYQAIKQELKAKDYYAYSVEITKLEMAIARCRSLTSSASAGDSSVTRPDVSVTFRSLFPIGSCLLPNSNIKVEYKTHFKTTTLEVIEATDTDTGNRVHPWNSPTKIKTFCATLKPPEKENRLRELKRFCDWLETYIPICDHNRNKIYLYYNQQRAERVQWRVMTDFDGATYIGLDTHLCQNLLLLGTESGLFNLTKSQQVLVPIIERLRKFGFTISVAYGTEVNQIYITNEEFLKNTVDVSFEIDYKTEFDAPELAKNVETYLKSDAIRITSVLATLCADYISPHRVTDPEFVLSPYRSYGDTLTPLQDNTRKYKCAVM